MNTDWVDSLRRVFADDPKALARIPTKTDLDPKMEYFDYDTTFAKSILDRGEFIGIDETAKEVSLKMWELEARLAAKT